MIECKKQKKPINILSLYFYSDILGFLYSCDKVLRYKVNEDIPYVKYIIANNDNLINLFGKYAKKSKSILMNHYSQSYSEIFYLCLSNYINKEHKKPAIKSQIISLINNENFRSTIECLLASMTNPFDSYYLSIEDILKNRQNTCKCYASYYEANYSDRNIYGGISSECFFNTYKIAHSLAKTQNETAI